MFETIAEQVAQRRQEIANADTTMMTAVFVIFSLTTTAYIAAVITGRPELYKLVFILGLTMVFFIARQELMIHRPAGYIKMTEQKSVATKVAEHPPEEDGIPSWESYKDNLWSTKFLLGPLDILAGLGIIYMFYCSGAALWTDSRQFVYWCIAGTIGGIVAAIVAIVFAGK